MRLNLVYDHERKAYYLDHKGFRWFIKPIGPALDSDMDAEQVALLANMVLSGHISVEVRP